MAVQGHPRSLILVPIEVHMPLLFVMNKTLIAWFYLAQFQRYNGLRVLCCHMPFPIGAPLWPKMSLHFEPFSRYSAQHLFTNEPANTKDCNTFWLRWQWPQMLWQMCDSNWKDRRNSSVTVQTNRPTVDTPFYDALWFHKIYITLYYKLYFAMAAAI